MKKLSLIFILLLLSISYCSQKQDLYSQTNKSKLKEGKVNKNMKTAIIGGGCFWCLEAVYEKMKGVSDVVSGYSGGQTKNPDYDSVCSGSTGHAEVVQITYDPKITSYEEILKVFFKIHDPTTLNRQGNDVGTQYRSVIYYHDEEQKKLAHKAIDEAKKSWGDKIVTEVTKLDIFYPAEDYHQDYFANNPGKGYCVFVVAPKLKKFEDEFSDKVKK